jgi:excisionase family DNA binding protein
MTLLTIREASQLIGRTPATIRRYIRSGRLRAQKEIGKFGEEYKIGRDDLLALGFSAVSTDLPVRREPSGPPGPIAAPEGVVPLSLFNELLLKHEQILVQYGMIRAGGQKLLEYKADAEAKDDALRGAEDRYQALRARAAKEIRFLRKHLREAEIEIEDRNIEVTLLQEKIKRLELAAAGAAGIQSFDSGIAEIREKERAIAHLESADPAPSPTYNPPEAWFEPLSPDDRGDDH